MISQDNQIYSLEDGGRLDQLVAARPRSRSPACSARPRPPSAGHGRRRLLVGRAQRLSLRERPPSLAGRACSAPASDQRLVALRHRCRSGDRQRPGVRGRPGRPHGRARAHHRPAPVGAQHRRHRDAVGRRRLDLRRHRRRQAALRLPRRTATSAGSTSCRSSQKAKSKKGQIDYSGPVLAGGRLIVAGSNGALIYVDPTTGASRARSTIGAPISLSPVVANSTLYIFDDRGRLHAFR